jgi:hypothetical protein
MDYYNINVLDISGSNTTVNTKLILIRGDDLHRVLVRLAGVGKTSIWKIDRTKIDNIILNSGNNPKDYVEIAHIYYNKGQPKDLVMANKSVCSITNKFNKIKKYGRGYIYEPIIDQGFMKISNFWFVNNTQPVFTLSSNFKNIMDANKNNFLFLNKNNNNKPNENNWSKYVNKSVCLRSNPKPWFGTNTNKNIFPVHTSYGDTTKWVIIFIIILVIASYYIMTV